MRLNTADYFEPGGQGMFSMEQQAQQVTDRTGSPSTVDINDLFSTYSAHGECACRKLHFTRTNASIRS